MTSLRRRIGRIALVAGVILVASLIVLGACVSLVAAYTGIVDINQTYLNIAVPGFVFGFIIMVVGLIAVLLPEGFSRDGVWIWQTGPIR